VRRVTAGGGAGLNDARNRTGLRPGRDNQARAGRLETIMTTTKPAKPQTAPRALKDDALDRAVGGEIKFKEFTITKKTDTAST
jgi:hypothetical protein